MSNQVTDENEAAAAIHRRNHWRGVCAGTAMRHAALLRIVPWGTTDLGKLSGDCYRVAVRQCKELMDWACETEKKQGFRTAAMEQHVNAVLWQALKPWERDQVPITTTNTNTEAHV